VLASTAKAIEAHVDASAPLEEGAFVLLRQGKGNEGTRLIASGLLLPPKGAWEIQERNRLRPSAQWLSAVIGQSIESNSGLLFVHSHPKGVGDAGLSVLDKESFEELARVIAPMLDGPFAAAVIHEGIWAAQAWDGGSLHPVERIWAVDRVMRLMSALPPTDVNELDGRQQDALGHIHDRLRHLDVAIVGSGGLGSPIAEQLVRMGVRRLELIDSDVLDTPSNVRRIFGATMSDLKATTALRKVDVVGRHLRQLGFDTDIRLRFADVRSERAFRALLDADVVLSATDTHGSRTVLNYLGAGYFLPVVDVGVRAAARLPSVLSGLFAEVRTLTPTTACLWCRGTLRAELIRAENLPAAERERLGREGYLPEGFGQPAPSVTALTVTAAGLAGCALLTLLSEEGNVASPAFWVDALLGDAAEVKPSEPRSGCRCRRFLGLGDSRGPALLG
jgi:hypothetical protein